jgi:hypothetical protein
MKPKANLMNTFPFLSKLTAELARDTHLAAMIYMIYNVST